MTQNLATKYSDKLDQQFTHGSYTDAWVNTKYDFDGVNVAKVYTVTTVAPSDYDADNTGDRFGGNAELDDTVATYTLTKDKSFKIAIDRGNNEQSMRAKKAGEVMKAEMNEQIIPMIDKDRIATACTAANAASQAITATADAYEDYLDANVYLDEAQAPLQGRVFFCSPAEYKAIKSQIVTECSADEYNSKLIGKGFVGTLDGVPVVKVPTSYFPAGYLGVIAHRDALLGVRQITTLRTKEDSELIDGTLLLGRFIFGSFALDAKKKAFAAIKSNASA